MADKPNTAVEQIYNMEQAISVNSFLDVQIGTEAVKLQVTTRNGADVARIVQVVMDHVEAYAKLRETYQKPDQPAPSESKKQEARSSGDGTYDNPKSFIPSLLTVTYENGKEYYKVHGQQGKFPKYPVAIWPEAMEDAGINYSDAVDPKEGFKLEGWEAFYVVNEKGNPQKVIKLVQKFP